MTVRTKSVITIGHPNKPAMSASTSCYEGIFLKTFMYICEVIIHCLELLLPVRWSLEIAENNKAKKQLKCCRLESIANLRSCEPRKLASYFSGLSGLDLFLLIMFTTAKNVLFN